MNEQIKELAEQARKYARDHVVECKQHGYYMEHNEYELRFEEKFAELIVQECLTFIEPMPGSGDIDDLALEAACEGIKEHFGVKL